MLSKLALDDAGMARCDDCGKLFEPQDETTRYCRGCAGERGLAVPAAQQQDIQTLLEEKTARLIALFNKPTASRRGPKQAEGLLPPLLDGPVCSRCKKRFPLEDSDFCLECHLELDKLLGTASRDLLSRVEIYEAPRRRTQGPSVMDAYGEQAADRGKIAFAPPHSQGPRKM